MGLPKLWGKDKSGSQGFVFSHVKTIYYNWASKILLKTKLDEMDAFIDAKIAKAMMSNQQVNDVNKVPTSALVYGMGQNITENANDIAEINGKFEISGNLKAFGAYGDKTAVLALQGYTENIDSQYDLYKLILREDGGGFSHQIGTQSTRLWDIALKSDLEFKLEYAAISYTTDIVGGTVYERNLDYTNAAFVIVATGLYDNVQDSVTVPAYYFKNSGAGTRTIVYYQSSTVEAYALGNNKIGIKVGNPVEHQSVKVWALKL